MKTTLLMLPLAIATLALTACSGGSDEKKQAADEKPKVKLASVSEADVPQLSTFTATVEADLINNISASQPNRIKQILVDEGQRVSKGQRVVVLDDVNTTTYQLQLDNARAALANVQLDYNRAVELFKIGGGTRQAVDQMEVQLVNAKNAVASAERALRNIKENTVLTSPISGVVTARNYDPGDMTGALPILTVATVQPVKIVINVSESDLAKVKKGMDAKVTFDTYPDETFTGHVTMISPTVDVASRTFGVEITLPNPDSRILPGMFGRVELNFGTMRHVVVPDLSVIKQQGSGNHYVYVYKDGKVSYNKVQLGRRIDNTYEIVEGVSDGDQVVISGQARLANGKEVDVIK